MGGSPGRPVAPATSRTNPPGLERELPSLEAADADLDPRQVEEDPDRAPDPALDPPHVADDGPDRLRRRVGPVDPEHVGPGEREGLEHGGGAGGGPERGDDLRAGGGAGRLGGHGVGVYASHARAFVCGSP